MFKNLERVLSEKNITNKGFAELLEVNEKTVWNKLNGVSEFSWKQIRKIMIIFPEYNIEYLLKQDEDIEMKKTTA